LKVPSSTLFLGSPDFASASVFPDPLFSPIMNLDYHVIVSTDGTFMGANTCYLLDTSRLDEEDLDVLNNGTDEERYVLAEEYGLDLEKCVIVKKSEKIFSVIAFRSNGATVMQTFTDWEQANRYKKELELDPTPGFSYCVSVSCIE
jgi:hypothetical protein